MMMDILIADVSYTLQEGQSTHCRLWLQYIYLLLTQRWRFTDSCWCFLCMPQTLRKVLPWYESQPSWVLPNTFEDNHHLMYLCSGEVMKEKREKKCTLDVAILSTFKAERHQGSPGDHLSQFQSFFVLADVPVCSSRKLSIFLLKTIFFGSKYHRNIFTQL